MRPLAILATTCALISPSVQADSTDLLFNGGSKALIAYKNDFTVDVIDRVTDGCLPRPQALKQMMETALQNSGYSISSAQPKPLGDKVIIDVLGHKTGSSGSCIIRVSAWINHWLVVNVPYAQHVPNGKQTYLSTRHPLGEQLYYMSKAKTQVRTEQAVASLAQQLHSDITKSRKLAEEKFPEMAKEYARINQL